MNNLLPRRKEKPLVRRRLVTIGGQLRPVYVLYGVPDLITHMRPVLCIGLSVSQLQLKAAALYATPYPVLLWRWIKEAVCKCVNVRAA